MDQTLHALGGLFLKALPTFILVLLLHFYLKRMFFAPLQRALKAREEATEGARKLAESALANAEKRAAEYDAALKAARAELAREQERNRNQWRAESAAAAGEAKKNAHAVVKQAREEIVAEAAAARQSLAVESQSLAADIARSILERRAN
jgi:F-type H+-transporting ATPase subunit b